MNLLVIDGSIYRSPWRWIPPSCPYRRLNRPPGADGFLLARRCFTCERDPAPPRGAHWLDLYVVCDEPLCENRWDRSEP